MTYDAKAVKVMIASPSDVSPERQIISGVLAEWNAINSEDKHLVLMPIAWETHSNPEMGDRPQAIINKQILKDCDILIAVFWTRIGSPTGTSVSGTVEEIEEHVAVGKPAMLYFSNTPVEPESIDQDQFAALKQFRATCRERGLYESYESLAEFKDKLLRQLSIKIIRTYGISASEPPALPPPPVLPTLSNEAKELLLEACQDARGTIVRYRSMEGLSIETNGRSFAKNLDARAEARWEAAINSLESEGLIADRGHKGEVFSVTDDGYQTADQLRQFRQRTQEPTISDEQRRSTLRAMFEAYRDDGFFKNLWRRAGIAGVDLIEAIMNARSSRELALAIDSLSSAIGAREVVEQQLKRPEYLSQLNRIRAELGKPPLEPPTGNTPET